MRLLKPTWVAHMSNDKRQPIFSVDIHPDGSRFATGGQGDSSDTGKIVIWNMEPVREESHEKDPNVPKILCQMENHLACVNCVRWSTDGKYLASAGDDKLIMIWQVSRQPGMSNVGSKMMNIESWRTFSTLRGHSGDVLSVAWSSHNVWLASCSVDNTIIIWNAHKFPEQVTVLRGHTGMIKGVTWDPVGSYLASQSDDKTVRVWRTYDWQLESCIKEPFKECGGTTPVLRLDWSPDGECIVTAHAMNNSGPTAQIINRSGWKTNLDLVGHRRAVTCARFSPRIMERPQSEGGKAKEYVVCAVGSKDRSISIWATCFKRPLIVLHDLFVEPILDITWSSNGSEMLCCAWDGTVAYFGFPTEEIGVPLSQQEAIAIHKKLYGKTVLSGESNFGSKDTNVFIESVEFLEASENDHESQVDCHSEDHSKPPEKSTLQVLESDHSASASSPVKLMNRQIETRTKDGKRKITPIFLASQHTDFSGVPTPYTSFQQQSAPQFSSSTETSTIIVEKKELTTSEMTKLKENSLPQNEAPSNHVEEAPVTVSSSGATEPQQNNQGVQPMEVTPLVPNQDHPEPMETQNKYTVVGQATPCHENQQRIQGAEGVEESRKKKDGRGRPRKDKLVETPARITNQTNAQPPSTPIIAVPQANPVFSAENSCRMNAFSLPLLRKMASPQTHKVYTSPDKDERPFVLETIAKSTPSDWQSPTTVRCQKADNTIWETLLPSPVIISSANEKFYSAITDDNMLHVYSTPCGRMMFPSIQLRAAPALYQCHDCFVMVVTRTGHLSLWDFQNKKCLIKNEPMEHLFRGESGSITYSFIKEDGVPLFVLSNGRSYSYSKDMECWILLSSKSDSVSMISESFTCKTGHLKKVLPRIKPSLKAMMMHKSDHHSRELATIAHLENQMACSLAMNSAEEYQEWLKIYARRLMHNGKEVKIRSLCQELLAPLYSRDFSSNKNFGFTMGLDNLALLKELVRMMRDYPAFQRMYNEYQLQVEEYERNYDL